MDGDVDTIRNARCFYLPLVKNQDYDVSKFDNRGQRLTSEYTKSKDVADIHNNIPSKRVVRTIDFSPCKSDVVSPNYNITPLFCSPSNLLSLSPITSFPFRQNELASPDSPISNTTVPSGSTLSALSPISMPTFSALSQRLPSHQTYVPTEVIKHVDNSKQSTNFVSTSLENGLHHQQPNREMISHNQIHPVYPASLPRVPQNHFSSRNGQELCVNSSSMTDENNNAPATLQRDHKPCTKTIPNEIDPAQAFTVPKSPSQVLNRIGKSQAQNTALWRPIPQMVTTQTPSPIPNVNQTSQQPQLKKRRMEEKIAERPVCEPPMMPSENPVTLFRV